MKKMPLNPEDVRNCSDHDAVWIANMIAIQETLESLRKKGLIAGEHTMSIAPEIRQILVDRGVAIEAPPTESERFQGMVRMLCDPGFAIRTCLQELARRQ